MIDLAVRPIDDDDIAAAVALLVAGSLTPQAEIPRNLADYRDAVIESRARGGDVLVAVRGSEVIGVCQLLIFRHFQHTGGWCAELESVHVRSDQRSQGVGAQLLRAAEELARRRGCYRIQLTSNEVRMDAHRFYETNGYQPSHRGFKKSLLDP